MKNAQAFERDKDSVDDWITPPEIVRACGKFDLDPCASTKQFYRTAKTMWTKDGLAKFWKGRVWLNPPYETQWPKWIKKLAEHGNGIALICARTSTEAFHDFVFAKASGILFLRGRVSFYKEGNGTYRVPGYALPAPCVLIAYGKTNAEILKRISFGAYVDVKTLAKETISKI